MKSSLLNKNTEFLIAWFLSLYVLLTLQDVGLKGVCGLSFFALKVGRYTPAAAAVLRVQSSAVRATRAHQTLTGRRTGNMFAKRLQRRRLLFDDRRQYSEPTAVFYSSYRESTCTRSQRHIRYYFCWIYCYNCNYCCDHTVSSQFRLWKN